MILELIGLSTVGYIFFNNILAGKRKSNDFPADSNSIVKLAKRNTSSSKTEDIFEIGTKRDALGLKLAVAALALPIAVPVAAAYYISIGINIFLLVPIFKSGVTRLVKRKQFSNNMLISIIALMHIRYGLIKLMSLGAVTYYLGSFIQYRAKNRSKKEIAGLYSNIPQKVWMVKDDIEIEIDTEKLRDGDIIAVHQSEIIPTDGIITEGFCAIDEHILTGEFQYSEKKAGDKIYASTHLVTGSIKYKVTESGHDTLVSQMNIIIKNAAQNKTELNMKGEVWADKSSLPIFIAGSAVYASGEIYKSIIVLKSSIGNTVRLTCPLIALNYLTVISKLGILVKDARALEKLSSVDVVLFDKTGTITEIFLLLPAILKLK